MTPLLPRPVATRRHPHLVFLVVALVAVCGYGLALTRPAVASVPVITTVAGGGTGEGVATRFPMEPDSLALWNSTLYSADISGNVVRALDLRTGNQRLVAGNGTLGFSGDGGPARNAQLVPGGIAVDGAGNVYISDTPNHRVRMVDAAGTIRTVAGTGFGGFGGDGGRATAAFLASPSGLAFDAAGNLYIADSGNWRIRKVTPQGIISTIAGNGQRIDPPIAVSPAPGEGGLATAIPLPPVFTLTVDAAGNVYFGYFNRVRRISPLGLVTTVAGSGASGKLGDGGPALSAEMEPVAGLALDAVGNMYAADYWNVRKINTGGIITSFIGTRTPYGAAFSGDGGPAAGAHLYRPAAVVAAPDGSFYVADTGNHRIRKVDATGVIGTIAGNGLSRWGGDGGPATEAQLSGPNAVAADREGNLYVLDGYVRKLDDGGTITKFAGDPAKPNQSAGDGGPATAASLASPSDIAVDLDGNVYIAEPPSNRVRKVDTTGIITTIVGSGPLFEGAYAGDGGPATAARLSWPSSVAVDHEGNVFIADSGNHRIRKIDTEGTITTFAGNGAADSAGDGGPATVAQLNSPFRLEADPFGNLYFIDVNTAKRIRRIDGAGTITTVATGVDFTGIAVDGGGQLFTSWYSFPSMFDISTARMQVGRVEPNGTLTPISGGPPGFVGDGGPAASALFYYPYDITFDATGGLFVADGLNRRVRRISGAGALATVGDNTSSFIERAYVDILGRQPTVAEIVFWGPWLVKGVPPEWVGGFLVTTTEFRSLVVGTLYQIWLGRSPTTAEAQALIDRLAAGTTIEQAWAELAGNDESWARHGRDPGAYIDDLYRRAFGRDPEPAGRAYWIDQLTHGFSRTTAALAFALNPASSTYFIELTCTRLLGRAADPAGLAFWVGHMQAGLRSEYVLAFFVGSAEYRARSSAK